jgi:Zn finger protein HypA/HybF involved in hydrogenase expression
MSCIWVRCLDCGQQFDIEDGIKGDFRCPICFSKFFEYDQGEALDEFFLRGNEDYEGIQFY